MVKTFALLTLAAGLAAAFAGLISHLLWGFFWHAVVWAVFVAACFAAFAVVVYWLDDQVTDWRGRARRS